MKAGAIRAVALACLALASSASMAQAYRVTNQDYGYYYSNTTVDLAGFFNGSYNSSEFYGQGYDYTQGSNAASIPAAAVFSFTGVGNPAYNLPTVAMQGYAYTDWGHNHAQLTSSGFDPVTTVSGPFAACLSAGGSCVPNTDYTMTFTTTPTAYGYANSRWEEIYQTGGVGGILGMTFHVHATLGSQPSTSGTPSGSAGFYWAQRDFASNTLGSASAGYDAASDSWWMQTYSNVSGYSPYTTGTGTLTINTAIIVQRSFLTGDAVYADSFMQTYVGGNGISDARDTVTLTNLDLPDGARLYASSGSNYGSVLTFAGGSGSGTNCSDLACVGGGGGGGPPVPEPQTYALMLAGLGALGLLSRRRRPA